MKVALCLSGQPRCAEETFPFIYENIIKPNNADVFIHMNFSKKQQYIEKSHLDNKQCVLKPNIDEILIDLYKPVKYLIEEPREFSKPNFLLPEKRIIRSQQMNKHKEWTEEQHRYHTVKQMSSCYYSIFKCNELKELYACENGIMYDYVIRLRFDAFPKKQLICKNYDPNFIYYQEIGQPDNLISDWFNFGSNTIMNVYSSLFFTMDYMNSFTFLKKEARQLNTCEPSDKSPGCYEHYIRDLMYHLNIPKCGINLEIGLQ